MKEREMELLGALTAIALMPDELDEWDGRDKFHSARERAMEALNWYDEAMKAKDHQL